MFLSYELISQSTVNQIVLTCGSPFKGSIDRSSLPPYLTECTFQLLMFASEYSRQCARAIDPLNWREAFRRGKATLWQTKTGAISPTGDRRAAAKSGLQSARELFSFHLQLHFHLVVMIKSTSPADWGPNFAPLQSQMSEPCVCNVPCNIFICVCV